MLEHFMETEIAALRATVAEQARQLEQARELIERQYTGTYPTYTDRCDALRAWLAANANAPSAERDAGCSCPCESCATGDHCGQWGVLNTGDEFRCSLPADRDATLLDEWHERM